MIYIKRYPILFTVAFIYTFELFYPKNMFLPFYILMIILTLVLVLDRLGVLAYIANIKRLKPIFNPDTIKTHPNGNQEFEYRFKHKKINYLAKGIRNISADTVEITLHKVSANERPTYFKFSDCYLRKVEIIYNVKQSLD